MTPINKSNCPENFGYTGGNVVPAINKCIDATGECFLGEKTYIIGRSDYNYDQGFVWGDNSIIWGWNSMKHGVKIVGSGVDKTILKFADDVQSRRIWGNIASSVPMLQTKYDENINDTIIEGITWDGNYNMNSSSSTLGAIAINGGNNIVQNCKFINFGVGDMCLHESFIVFLNNRAFTKPGCKILNCYFTKTTGKHDSKPGQWVNENTYACICGGDVEISNNVFEDVLFDRVTQQSPNHGITIGGCDSGLVKGNIFKNFQGSCIYTDSWTNKNVEVVGNIMRNSWNFLSFNCQMWPDPKQISYSTDYDIHHNDIELSDGVFLYSWDKDGIPTVFFGINYDPSVDRTLFPGFNNLVARDNRIVLGIHNNNVTSILQCFWPWGWIPPESKVKLINNQYIDKRIKPPSNLRVKTIGMIPLEKTEFDPDMIKNINKFITV